MTDQAAVENRRHQPHGVAAGDQDRDGNDLYPEIKRRAADPLRTKHNDMVRFEIMTALRLLCDRIQRA